MKPRHFLLATTAIVPSASAAVGEELLLAVEPIDYVAVCTASGEGYYRVPGTQTCLSVGGEIKFNVAIFDSRSISSVKLLGEDIDELNPIAVTPKVQGLYIKSDYAANWSFTTEVNTTFSTQTPSDLGVIETYLEIEVERDFQTFLDTLVESTLDTGYASIGPVLFGYDDTIYEYDDGYTIDSGINADSTVDQIQYARTFGAWGIAVAAEDPRDRYDQNPKNATGDYPDLALALTRDFTNADVQASFGVTDRTSGTGWGAQLGGTIELANNAISLRGIAAYSENAPAYVGGVNCTGACANEGAWWNALLATEVDLTDTFALQGTVSYVDQPSSYTWVGAVQASWSPTDASAIEFELVYGDYGGAESVAFKSRFTTSFGG
ncbi:MAG: hypothetical protein GY798_12310 [Hyphomicrobiales bacterium]|nr:hypothetical protein [Hyphomicrobiales bacterium]